MSCVVEINSMDGLAGYAASWRSLLAQTRGATFLHSFEWLDCYWRHFGDGQKLRVLIVMNDGTPSGILPLTLKREATRLGLVRVLTFPLHDWASFYGPIGPCPHETLVEGLRHLRTGRCDFDLLDLRYTNPELDGGQTLRAMDAAGFSAGETTWKTTYLIEFTDSWQAFLARRTSKFRNNLRRSEKRAALLGGVQFERYRPAGSARGDGDPRWSLYDECSELAERTWQGSSRNGTTLSHREVHSYFRDMHEVAARFGGVDVGALRLNGRLIAFLYNYYFAGALTGIRMGYDAEFSEISPGSLLLARSLEDSFARGDTVLDLGTTPTPYKHQWRTRMLSTHRCTYYSPRSPRGQLLRLKHRLFRATDDEEGRIHHDTASAD